MMTLHQQKKIKARESKLTVSTPAWVETIKLKVNQCQDECTEVLRGDGIERKPTEYYSVWRSRVGWEYLNNNWRPSWRYWLWVCMSEDKCLSFKTIFRLDVNALPVPIIFDHIRPASEELDLSNGDRKAGGDEKLRCWSTKTTRHLVCQCSPKYSLPLLQHHHFECLRIFQSTLVPTRIPLTVICWIPPK